MSGVTMSPEEPVIELESEFLAKGKPTANVNRGEAGACSECRFVRLSNPKMPYRSRRNRWLLHRAKNSGS